jgi:hypothetical protein
MVKTQLQCLEYNLQMLEPIIHLARCLLHKIRLTFRWVNTPATQIYRANLCKNPLNLISRNSHPLISIINRIAATIYTSKHWLKLRKWKTIKQQPNLHWKRIQVWSLALDNMICRVITCLRFYNKWTKEVHQFRLGNHS